MCVVGGGIEKVSDPSIRASEDSDFQRPEPESPLVQGQKGRCFRAFTVVTLNFPQFDVSRKTSRQTFHHNSSKPSSNVVL